MMPGMLSAEQLARLDGARGARVRPVVPHVHDPSTTKGAIHDGESAVRRGARGSRRPCTGSRPACTPTRPPRSSACRKMLAPLLLPFLSRDPHHEPRRSDPRVVRRRRVPRRREAPTCPRWRPNPDPRVGLRAGLIECRRKRPGTCVWSRRRPPPGKFFGVTNSDLAFTGPYAIQGNYNGFQVWDISTPGRPTLKIGFRMPRVAERRSRSTRTCCSCRGEGDGADGSTAARKAVHDSVSAARLRGIRIFDITDIANPKYIGNVQTCRGLAHAHPWWWIRMTATNVYVYVSGSAPVRSAGELPRLRRRAARLEPQQRAVPHRGHQGAAGAPRAGRHRERAAHLQRPDRPRPGTARRRKDIAAAAKEAADWAGQGGLHGQDGRDGIRPARGLDQADARQRGQGARRRRARGNAEAPADSAGVRARPFRRSWMT